MRWNRVGVKKLSTPLAGAAIAMSPAIASPFDGAYSPRTDAAMEWFCSLPYPGGRWQILGDRLAMEEGQCVLENPVPVRDMQAVLYDATCRWDTDVEKLRLFVAAVDDGIVIVESRGAVYELVRCKR